MTDESRIPQELVDYLTDSHAVITPPKCGRCGEPCFKVPVPAHPGDDAWVWGHDCPP